jgi:hypothetical protein
VWCSVQSFRPSLKRLVWCGMTICTYAHGRPGHAAAGESLHSVTKQQPAECLAGTLHLWPATNRATGCYRGCCQNPPSVCRMGRCSVLLGVLN